MSRIDTVRITVLALAGAAWVAPPALQRPVESERIYSSALGEYRLQLPESFSSVAAINLRQTVETVTTVLVERYGPVTKSRYDLILARDHAEMASWTGHELPEWFQAVTLQHPSRVVLLIPTTFDADFSVGEFEQTLLHEFTHLYLFRVAPAAGGGQMPGWFHEGLAVYTSSGFNRGFHWALVKARLVGRFYDLNELRRFHHSSADWSTQAYAQAYLAVREMAELYGPGIFREIFTGLAAGDDFGMAFTWATGESPAKFQEHYRAQLERRYNLLMVVADPRVLYISLPLLLIVAYLARLRRNAVIKARWQVEEELRLLKLERDGQKGPERFEA
ncbi:MAG: hypothetical protein IID13_10865 [Candidatus Marinimicrobia bacterium]|nr:hypothetical protein [Candidatus Neomarinimicrobiota bacterium]